MTAQEKDRIECAIRHIKTAVDIDPWAVEIAVEAMRKQIPKKTQKDLQPTCNKLATDTISRQDAIDALYHVDEYNGRSVEAIRNLPSAQPEWNNHTVACLLAELFDDTCACNYNGIDEWLPEKCEVIDSCPNPVGVACWEQYLKHRAERRTDESDRCGRAERMAERLWTKGYKG